jgi:putative mRNA 3-end processing factor
MVELRRSLKECKIVMATPQTIDFLIGLEKLRFEDMQRVKALPYERSMRFEGDSISFYPANHILGSAQVLVTDEERNLKMLYTSDFRLSKTPVIKCDVLVIEATYGNPAQVRPFRENVENTLIELVQEKLRAGPVYIFGYYGKLQEAVHILKEADVNCPMIMPSSVFKISKIYEKYGIDLGHYYLAPSEESNNITKSGEPYMGIYHTASSKRIGEGATKIFLSGWEFEQPCKRVGEESYLVALSDHSDFNQLIEYVERSKPESVITDGYRGNAKALATEITKKLGIPAKPMP